jgi:hypothetical protein
MLLFLNILISPVKIVMIIIAIDKNTNKVKEKVELVTDLLVVCSDNAIRSVIRNKIITNKNEINEIHANLVLGKILNFTILF